MKIYAYNQGSASAKALAEALGIKRVKHDGRVIKVDTLINWGASVFKRAVGFDRILNCPDAVKKAANKLETFKALAEAEVSKPLCTTDREIAEIWIADEGHAVVCRTVLNGHSGEGIVIAETVEQLVDAPLYTRYIKKKEEYRIHVFRNPENDEEGDPVYDAFFIQRKARKKEVPDEEVNWKVRNLAGGFIFANKDVEVADEAKQEAVKAVNALGLDFGAVDIIQGTDGKFYVLEVNTACGLEGTTLEKYVAKFQQFR